MRAATAAYPQAQFRMMIPCSVFTVQCQYGTCRKTHFFVLLPGRYIAEWRVAAFFTGIVMRG
jgi:hypothetical protein